MHGVHALLSTSSFLTLTIRWHYPQQLRVALWLHKFAISHSRWERYVKRNLHIRRSLQGDVDSRGGQLGMRLEIVSRSEVVKINCSMQEFITKELLTIVCGIWKALPQWTNPTYMYTKRCEAQHTLGLTLFSGPTQLFVACSTEKRYVSSHEHYVINKIFRLKSEVLRIVQPTT